MTGRRTALIFALSTGFPLGKLGAQAPRARPVSLTAAAESTRLPRSSLSVRTRGGWVTWWSSANAPAQWEAPDSILHSAANVRGSRLAYGEVSVGGSGEAWRTRLVIVRLDPQSMRIRLDTAADENGYGAWRLDRVPNEAAFAVNAGQFGARYPWGLVLLDGHQYLPPGTGSLVTTIAIDSAGAVRWASGDSSAQIARGARWAFQSYPTLLHNGEIPLALQEQGRGIDLRHRDARLAVGLQPDGTLLFVMTRFDALGRSLGFVPFGLTVPEMAAVMGGLGSRDAVLLDGGVSAQMLIREMDGFLHRWRGLRAVPLALIALPRFP